MVQFGVFCPPDPPDPNDIKIPTFFDVIFQALVIVITCTTVGIGVYGVFNIELNYDSIWYMDQHSYQTRYYETLMEVFPEHGERVEIYVGKSNDQKIQFGWNSEQQSQYIQIF